MKFLVDANLPRALATWLAAGGDDASYVDDLLTAPARDQDIWALAALQGLVIVTKDADFAGKAMRAEAAQVVWVRCGNLKLSAFKQWFEDRAEAMRRLLAMGERVIELR